MPGRQLRLLLGSQDAGDLRHHLRVRDFQFDLYPGAGLSRGAHGRFVECARHRVRFTVVQSAQLIEQRFIAFTEAVANCFDLRFLSVSQVKLAAKRTEWSKAFTWPARSARPTTKPPPGGGGPCRGPGGCCEETTAAATNKTAPETIEMLIFFQFIFTYILP